MRAMPHYKQKTYPDFKIEKRIFRYGYHYIGGIDEVGYGSLAGPVCIGCVVLENKNLSKWLKAGINDSKKILAPKRQKIFKWIVKNALDWSVCFISHKIINAHNIKKATIIGAKNALRLLRIKPDFILVDGTNRLKYLRIPQATVIRGDEKSIAIAAASIVAKVLRDKLMKKIHRHYKKYDFSRNKGYGTKLHIKALQEYGQTPLHRTAFIDSIVQLSNRKSGIDK